MEDLLYRSFDRCIKALRENRLDAAREALREVAKCELGPRARALHEYLRARVPLFDATPTAVDSIALDDFGVILMMTDGNVAALARSIDSVTRARATSGHSVHCLLFESLHPSTDVNALQGRETPLLPIYVRDAIQAGVIDYMVDHGTTLKGLRRAVRCSRGRFVCLLREGDELWIDHDAGTVSQRALDILVAVPSAAASDRERFASNFGAPVTLRALPALLATSVVYDGALLADRDYLDDLLGSIGYDGNDGYFGYINEVLTLALARDSGRVGLVHGIGCAPAEANLASHRAHIECYTLYCIAERRKGDRGSLEKPTESLVDSILDLARGALLGKPVQLGAASSPAAALRAAQAGLLPWLAGRWVLWLVEQLRAVALGGPQPVSEMPAVAPAGGRQPVVSFVSSLFRGQRLVHSFLANITHQSIFPEGELIVVSPEPNLIQDLVCEVFALACEGVRVRYLSDDPGIYECWNIAIRQARGRYLSNANLDDRRDPAHAARLIELLELTGASVASSAVAITHDIHEIGQSTGHLAPPRNGAVREIWFGASGHSDHFRGLNDFFKFGAAGEVIQCMNFPHCMPVWRSELHQRFGYFDEWDNGTYADFAYWLQAAARGERFAHLSEPLGLYYVDRDSHNRRNAKKVVWQAIVGKHLPQGTRINAPIHVEQTPAVTAGPQAARGEVRFNFGNQIQQNFGKHRSGWSYVLAGLERFHDPSAPVYCDAFIEKKFVWGGDRGEGGAGPVVPYDKPWVGFVHVPPDVPSWFQSEQANQRIFSRRSWRKSIEHCKGLFVLTEYHRQHLERMLRPDFPISVLRHPTEFPEVGFDFDRYLQNPQKRVVQIGWWLRKLDAITKISVPGHIPTLLGKDDWSKNLLTYSERRASGVTLLPSQTESMAFLDNDAYDQLLAENIGFLDFYDTSANNAVIECVARGTPIVVCRHPAVEEYLGADYPLFFDNYHQISSFISDSGRIKEAHAYLLHDAVRQPLNLGAFLEAFMRSEVAANCG